MAPLVVVGASTAKIFTCLYRFEALPLGLLGLEGNVHAVRVVVPLAQALEPLVRFLEGRFKVVLGGEQAELALKPGLPRLEVSRCPVCLGEGKGKLSEEETHAHTHTLAEQPETTKQGKRSLMLPSFRKETNNLWCERFVRVCIFPTNVER